MHPGIREIIHTSDYCHASMKKAAALLPEDDAELDGWIAKAVAEHDVGAFAYLVLPAMHLGRKVASRHIEGGLQLMPNPYQCGCVLWHLDGEDLPERVLAGLELGGINPRTQAYAYFTAWHWCAERRNGELPAGFVASARKFCLSKYCPKDFESLMALLATNLKDGPMLKCLEITQEQIESEAVAAARLNLENTWLRFAKGPILDQVPAEPVRKHAGFTMRRSVENIGRNEPCRCGSGKKYKRCCVESDRQRLSRSSDVAGKTREELRAAPAEFLTMTRLEKLQPPEMARIDPLELDEELVEYYLKKLGALGMFGEAVEAMETLGWSDGIAEAWCWVTRQATSADRKDVVERLIQFRWESNPEQEIFVPPATMLLRVKDDAAETLKLLEEMAMDALSSKSGDELAQMAASLLRSTVPALGILVARGSIPVLDPKSAVATLDGLLAARTRLELSDDEPYSDIMEMILAKRSAASGKKNAEALRLANQKLEAKAGEVRKMKLAIDEMKHEIARREKTAVSPTANVQKVAPADEHSLQEMRMKVRFLKNSLKERHEERAILRRDLEKTLTDLEALRDQQARNEPHAEPADAIDAEDSLVLPGEVEGNQPVRVIAFPKNFHRTLEGFPKQVSKGAMALLGRLAAGESAAFTGVVRLKARPDTLRVRIGIDHRLLFRLLPDSVQVVDLINRRDLESRIKQL
ncbi:MAG: SEC-C metal-binding domain-containing protein [Verrucomicrobiota bacterium]